MTIILIHIMIMIISSARDARLLGRGTKLFLELFDKKFLSVDIHTDRTLGVKAAVNPQSKSL